MSDKLFNIKSKYNPSPDQANAISEITKNIEDWDKFQTLWWVTWSGKTFTMANIIQEIRMIIFEADYPDKCNYD